MRDPTSSTAVTSLQEAALPRREFLAVVGLGAAMFAASAPGAEPQKAQTPFKVGDQFPDIELPGADGKLVRLSTASAGRVTLIDFWGVWCRPCIEELPGIARTYARLKDEVFVDRREGGESIIGEGFTVFSVALHGGEGDRKGWLSMIKSAPITWDLHVGTENDTLLQETYQVGHYPMHYVVDRDLKLIDIGADPARLPFLLKKLIKQ